MIQQKILIGELKSRVRALKNRNIPALRRLRRDFTEYLAGESGNIVLAIAQKLVAERRPDFRFIAYELIYFHLTARASVRPQHLTQLGRGLESWGEVDMFGYYLSGPAWREHQIPDKIIHRWARSKDRWWQRAALVSTVPLNSKARGGSGDPVRTLRVCKLLVNDRDDMVVKAMSWALRELVQRDPSSVLQFLRDYETRLAPRVKREVNNKLSTGLKNP